MRILIIILGLILAGCNTCYISGSTTFVNDPNRIGVWYQNDGEWDYGYLKLEEGSYEFYRTTNK